MRPFADFLRDYRKGALDAACAEALAEVVRAAGDTGKAGTLTLKIEVKPDSGQMQIVANVATKLPKADLPKAVFFADLDGDLHRSDPAQREMFNEATGEVRERTISEMARADRA